MALPSSEITRILVDGVEFGASPVRCAFLPARPDGDNWTITVNCTPNPRFWEQPRENFAQGSITDFSWPLVAGTARAHSSEEAEAKRQAREEAGIRAQELLCQHLTPQQCKHRGDFGHFWTEVAGHKFCIGCTSDFIYEEDERGKLASYCLQTEGGGLPREDRVLAILLLLRHAPEEFFKKANLLGHRDSDVSICNRLEWTYATDSLTPHSAYREWYDRHYHQ